MASQKLFLIPGCLIAVIDRFELAVGGDVLHLQGQLVHLRPGIPEACFKLDDGGGCYLASIQQFLIAADTMLRQKVGGIRDPFQIFDGRPAAIACTLLRLDVVLDINEQADLSAPVLRLAGRSGASDDPGGDGFFRVVYAQGFHPGKPLLVRGPAGNVFPPLDFVSFPLQAEQQIFKVGGGGDQPVNSGFQLCLVAGPGLGRLVFDVAFAPVLSGNDDGQAVLLADPV